MVIYNWPGALGVAVAALIGVTAGILADWAPVGLFTTGVGMVFLDAIIRVVLRRRYGPVSWWFIAPRTGGHVYYIPVWILGLGLAGFGTFLLVTEPRPAPLPPPSPRLIHRIWFKVSVQPGEEKQQLEILWNQKSELRDVSLTVTYHVDHGPAIKVPLVVQEWPGETAQRLPLDLGPDQKLTSLRILGRATFGDQYNPGRVELSITGLPMYEPDEPHD